ncbi:MAG: hypothetical protein ABI135_06285 [Rhodoferax sp.]
MAGFSALEVHLAPLAADVVYPLFGLLPSPALAAAMSPSSLGVVSNALCLRAVNPAS